MSDLNDKIEQLLHKVTFIEYKLNLIMDNLPLMEKEHKFTHKTVKDSWEEYKK